LTLEHIVPDTESDGLPDAWETTVFGGTGAQAGTGDADSDGLTNQYEYQAGTNANQSDSDTDGLADGAEYFTHRTDPLIADTDGDGLTDGGEITAGVNPLVTDTDGDGLTDGAEVNTHHSDPLDRDSDNDDYYDGVEVAAGTNPLSNASYPLYSTQVLPFSGGDQGEGLDFTGNFVAAARFGLASLAGSWPVRDALFIPYHSVPNLSQNGTNEIGSWTAMNFAAPLTAADTNLAAVTSSIRYRTTTFNIDLTGLTTGRSYKLQLLFAESCCPGRGFDVYVNNTLVADEFSPPAVQGGASPAPARGAAVVFGFVATTSALNIRLDRTTVTTPALNDPNPILNAMSVEEIPAGADLDTDGLPDSWENDNFGDIEAQSGTGDPDNDGLLNSEELSSSSDPNDADTDNDGLNDGLEVHTSLTNPRMADSDGDGLTDGGEINVTGTNPNNPDSDRDTLPDGAEVNTHSTNPLSIDTDSDGFNDATEMLNSADPASAASKPGDTHVARVLGPDAAEGLDLFGNFLYAFNVGVPGAAGPVHDANFTADLAPGIALTAPHQDGAWFNPDFGSSADENGLEFVYQSIRWAEAILPDPNNKITTTLTGLTPGRQYKLQLMFAEACCPFRYFDVYVDNALLADEFNVAATQGSHASPVAGAAIIHTFTSTADTVMISLDGTTTIAGTDHNAILSGVTLEALVNSVALEVTGAALLPAGFKLDVRGTPGYAYSVDWSPDFTFWEEVNDALVPDGSGNATWTDSNSIRVGPGIRRGFYKVRDPVEDPTP
jgi:hypothetical protein